MKPWRILAMLTLFSTLALLGACDSDDGTSPVETDTTAPLVVQVYPAQSETYVDVDETVVVTFSEDMDPDSATDNITLSNGTLGALGWTDARTLSIAHTDWTEGTEITVTVGTGLADEAGNSLAEAFAWSFWTETDDVMLLNTLPNDGDVDVPLNSQIWLEFSEGMDQSTLPGAITLSSPDKTDIAYTLGGNWDEWTLTPDADLPASTLITVTVGTGAQSYSGDPLAAEASFSFTTSDAVDTTPPNLISWEPANGSTISADTEYLRLTFDEPVTDDSLEPTSISGPLMMNIDTGESVGVWSANHTVLTIGLRGYLMAGAELAVTFESYEDMHGNVQTDPASWSVTVAGENHYPVVDELIYYFASWTTIRNKDESYTEFANRINVQSGNEFWRESGYFDEYHDVFVWNDYDRFEMTSSAIRFLGFVEVDEDPVSKADDSSVTFSPAIDWLKLPVGDVTSWSGESSFVPTPEAGKPDRVAYQFTVDSTPVDLAGPSLYGANKTADLALYWPDCRHMTLTFTLYDDDTAVGTRSDQYWFCPGVGIVRQRFEETEGTETWSEDVYLRWIGFAEDLIPGK